MGVPDGSVGTESISKAGDAGLTPGLGRFHWSRKWQPNPGFLPGKSHDRGAWQATVQSVAKSQAQLSTEVYIFIYIYIFMYIYLSVTCLLNWAKGCSDGLGVSVMVFLEEISI